MLRLHQLNGGASVDKPLADHVHRDLHRPFPRSLPRAALQHPQPVLLDRKLYVLCPNTPKKFTQIPAIIATITTFLFLFCSFFYHHILVMSLKNFTILHKLLVSLRHAILHGV